MEPTERSIPPEMMTIVAPTGMIAKQLASVPTWMRVCEVRKLVTGWPLRRSTWLPANAVSTAPRRMTMTTSPACWDASSFRNIRREDKTVGPAALSMVERHSRRIEDGGGRTVSERLEAFGSNSQGNGATPFHSRSDMPQASPKPSSALHPPSSAASRREPAADFLRTRRAHFLRQLDRTRAVGGGRFFHRHPLEERVRQAARDLRIVAGAVAPVVREPGLGGAQPARAA